MFGIAHSIYEIDRNATMNPAFTNAQAGDRARVADLLTKAGLPAEDFAGHLTRFTLAWDGNHLIGAIGLEAYPPSGLLRSLVVSEEYRSIGLGSELLSLIEAKARELGIGSLYLLTTTAETFFGSRGYCRIDRREAPPAIAATAEFESLCPATAIFMVRELPARG